MHIAYALKGVKILGHHGAVGLCGSLYCQKIRRLQRSLRKTNVQLSFFCLFQIQNLLFAILNLGFPFSFCVPPSYVPTSVCVQPPLMSACWVQVLAEKQILELEADAEADAE